MRLLLCLLLVCCLPGLAFAQDGVTWDEAVFWARLRDTEAALRATPTAAALAALGEQWRDVRAVWLADGTALALDLDWLRAPLASGNAEALTRLRRHLLALLSSPALNTAGQNQGASLSALDDVLRDPRFQYADVTPTPIATPALPDLNLRVPAFGAGLSQLVLLLVGGLALAAVVVYAVRALRVQPATQGAAGALPDDPKTADGAADLAAAAAARHDYRSAMRYLYLASLLWLDERGVLRYDSSLTNREHLRQVRDRAYLHDLLRAIVNAFEDVWYGDLPVDDAAYARYVQQIEQLRSAVP
jgi:hypothetical protein